MVFRIVYASLEIGLVLPNVVYQHGLVVLKLSCDVLPYYFIVEHKSLDVGMDEWELWEFSAWTVIVSF